MPLSLSPSLPPSLSLCVSYSLSFPLPPSFSPCLSNLTVSLHSYFLLLQAIDGFLLVLDKEGNVLYVSETIIDCIGLRQVR